MLDILREHLRTGAPAELATMVEQAHDLFEEFGLEDYDIGFSEILLMADNEGASESIIKIVSLTSQLQDSILSQLQIDLVDEATVSDGNKILLALRHLDNTELSAQVAQICEEVTSPEEALAEVLALVNGEEEENLVILLDSVSPSLIMKIHEVSSARALEERVLQDNEANRVYAENLLLFSEAVDNQWLFIFEQVKHGEPMGKLYSEYHSEIIAEMEARQAKTPLRQQEFDIKLAVQLFAAALISQDGMTNPRAVVMAELTKTYGDLDRTTPVYLELDNLAIRFQTYRQTRPATNPTLTVTGDANETA